MENSIVRCKVCGRRLTNPLSIARGMGPKCAGVSSSRRARLPRLKRSSTRACPNGTARQVNLPLPLIFAADEPAWECNCKENKTHPMSELACSLCGARQEDHFRPRAEAAVGAGLREELEIEAA